MKKIIIIGCPGSGKSMFSMALRDKIGLPLYHLDMMFWNPNKTTVEKALFLERLSDVLEKSEWIIDGNYASTMEMRLEKCDTVFYLDYPTEVCLDGVRARRGKKRCDMPWVETEEDTEFTEYVKSFNDNEKPKILRLLEKYRDKDVFVFKSREDADVFLRKQ